MKMRVAKKSIKNKSKKGLWPIIALFNYRDEQINYSCAIRVRKFQYEVPYCEEHGIMPRGIIDDNKYVSGGTNCPYCFIHKREPILKLHDKKEFMYCAYVVNSEEFINVEAILSRYTLLSWRKTAFRFRQKHSVLAYAKTLEGIRRGLMYAKDLNDNKVGVVFYAVTDEQMDKTFKQSENNRLLREI